MKFFTWLLLLFSLQVGATTLPGLRVDAVGATAGFATSLAIDSKGTIYYSTTSGSIFRLDASGQSVAVASVVTESVGNSGLLGMALVDDRTAVVHYTTPRQTYDVVAKIDLVTGDETIVHAFACDIDFPERGSPSEHHGGNPSVARDGSIFVGIGDFGGGLIASLPDWNGGKVFRIATNGEVVQFARGLRNPFDTVWDDDSQRLVIGDNGPVAGDEIHVVDAGAYCGWPFTFGNNTPVTGAVEPDYVFETTVAPTGILRLNGANPFLRHGYLLGAFVTKAIYYFPDLDARPIPDPVAIIEREAGFVIDVAQTLSGDIYFTNGNAILRLRTPTLGDCNGDGIASAADFASLSLELADGGPHAALDAPNGNYRGSWGCDADGDGMIETLDIAALARIIGYRQRAVGR